MAEHARPSYPPMTPKVQASASISKNQRLPILWHIHFVQERSLACLPDDTLFPWFWWDGRRVEERPLLHLDLMRSVQIVPESWFHLLSLTLCASYGKTSSTLSLAVCAALQNRRQRHLCPFAKKRKLICYWMDRIWSLRLKSPEQEIRENIKMVWKVSVLDLRVLI